MNRLIHGTFAVDFDPEVLILLTEKHSTINKIARYLHVCVDLRNLSRVFLVLYHFAYL